MDAQTITEGLQGRWNGNSGKCRCPAHNDHNPSLSVTDSGFGKVRVKCFAGCSRPDVIDALKRKGLWPERWPQRDLPPGIRDYWKTRNDEGYHYVDHWRYVNESGEPLGYEVRYENGGQKQVIPFFTKKDGEFKPGYPAKDFLRPLYNLPYLKDADTVWIMEGAKCCDRAWQDFGLTATTSPGGSDSAGKADWSPLAGKKIILWPDNDKPGAKYAATVQLMLRQLSAPTISIEVVEIEKLNLPEGGDVVDWADTGAGSIEDLLIKRIEDTSEIGVILIEGGELSKIVDQCEAVLLKHHPGEVFQRGGRIVRVISLETGCSQDGVNRKPGALQIVEMGEKYLTELFGRSATFLKFNSTMQDHKLTDPPEKYAKHYLDRVGDWKLPTLSGIIEAPTLRPDGTLLHRQGFDEETGLYVNSRGPLVDVKPMPTEQIC